MAKSRRHKMSKRKSKRLFRNTANKTNVKNLQAVPMRGGFRL